MLEAYGISDIGCVRTNNEDYCLLSPELGLYVVADGMGGARAGEHASRLAVETVRDYIRNTEHSGAEALTRAVEQANRAVLGAASASKELEGMGTTLVAALQAGPELLIASVGDSRAYSFDGEVLTPITVDQTWVQEVGRRLGLDEASLRKHPMRHVLTMAIGVTEDLRIAMYKLLPSPGEQILICSDGLHGAIEGETISEVLRTDATLEEKCRRLVTAARDHGGPDNITVIILQTF